MVIQWLFLYSSKGQTCQARFCGNMQCFAMASCRILEVPLLEICLVMLPLQDGSFNLLGRCEFPPDQIYVIVLLTSGYSWVLEVLKVEVRQLKSNFIPSPVIDKHQPEPPRVCSCFFEDDVSPLKSWYFS